jgi:hypothetical protein
MPTKKTKSKPFGKAGTPSVPDIFKKKTSAPPSSGIDKRDPVNDPKKVKPKEE